MPTPPDLPSRYEHRAQLGAGGMGAVWKVFDRERGEEVALKTFAPAEGVDVAEARFLFKQEFWAMASLGHPHLVAAYDYGETSDGTPYFTMALVPGHDLGTDLPRPEAEVRAWLPGVLAALGHLHAHGWLHGDLKPENVRLGDDGRATLMDLGLLRRQGEAAGPVRGTLAYLAPEAIRQGPLDGRADLYALGAVLFHALTGRPPFEQADTLGLLRAHLDATPPAARTLAPELSPAFDAALRRLLAKDPAARFPDVAALGEALELEVALEASQGLLAAPLVGRDEALATLRAAALQPAGEAWAVTGEPG
ncbi:MAG: repeat-containing protein, partial [Cyanobacteria bacterium RYN_339]|nr:repeat-containing protein [Cyanobacteria bacterium RYN_339]